MDAFTTAVGDFPRRHFTPLPRCASSRTRRRSGITGRRRGGTCSARPAPTLVPGLLPAGLQLVGSLRAGRPSWQLASQWYSVRRPSPPPPRQAYAPGIAVAAATQGHFLGIPGFLEGRIAWLKTSFLWMMYRWLVGGAGVLGMRRSVAAASACSHRCIQRGTHWPRMLQWHRVFTSRSQKPNRHSCLARIHASAAVAGAGGPPSLTRRGCWRLPCAAPSSNACWQPRCPPRPAATTRAPAGRARWCCSGTLTTPQMGASTRGGRCRWRLGRGRAAGGLASCASVHRACAQLGLPI